MFHAQQGLKKARSGRFQVRGEVFYAQLQIKWRLQVMLSQSRGPRVCAYVFGGVRLKIRIRIMVYSNGGRATP